MRKLELTGIVFERLTAFQRVRVESSKRAAWRCNCSCGKSLIVATTNLVSGNTKSCGCLQVESAAIVGKSNTKHGYARVQKSRTYKTWRAMFDRCRDENRTYYGALGVIVCDRWHKFENFLADMGERPAGKTIDRFPNPSGDYTPGNCRWATSLEQRHNRRPDIHEKESLACS